MDERLELARNVAADSAASGDITAVSSSARALDGLEADLALARGRLLHARFLADGQEDPRELALFERAARVYADLGDERGEGEAVLWSGMVHQIVRHDEAAALPKFERALELAMRAEDHPTTSHALRHLALGEQRAGRLTWAKALFEESTRLRREAGDDVGVASNLVALAQIAHAEGRTDDASGLLDEAGSLAGGSGAASVSGQVEATRGTLGGVS